MHSLQDWTDEQDDLDIETEETLLMQVRKLDWDESECPHTQDRAKPPK
jgi:hypothetical protein